MPREHNLRKDLPKNKSSKKLNVSKVQRSPVPQQAEEPVARTEPNQHQHVQQLMLNAFSDSFSHHAKSSSLIQELKQHLFNRDFPSAFGRQDLLEVYALRWSPSRALAYADLFCDCEYLMDLLEDLLVERTDRRGEEVGPVGGENESTAVPQTLPSDGLNKSQSKAGAKVTCLGAGSGAEVVAFAGYLNWLRYGTSQTGSTGILRSEPLEFKPLLLQTIDIANWSAVVNSLISNITSSVEKSESSQADQATPQSLSTDSSHFQASFSQIDVLSPDLEPLTLKIQSSSLVTLMFTLNELYTTSVSRTTTLLLTLTSILESGSLLLVVDSPGSYSTVKLNKRSGARGETIETAAVEEKRYPMQWLLDHTLIQAPNVGSSKNACGEKLWEKVYAQDSKWFRLPKGLKYPIALEDMRYQVHLYRRL